MIEHGALDFVVVANQWYVACESPDPAEVAAYQTVKSSARAQRVAREYKSRLRFNTSSRGAMMTTLGEQVFDDFAFDGRFVLRKE